MDLRTKTIQEKIMKKCGTITCIHCIGEKCNLENCDFYERIYCQED